MRLSRNIRRPANDTVKREAVSIETKNPKSVGLDMASTHSIPYVGMLKGTGNRAGRKRGQIFR